MYKIINLQTIEVEHVESWQECQDFISEYILEANKELEEDEKFTTDDFDIEEYQNCGYCGCNIEIGERYCSRNCSKADNTEGV